MGSRGKREGVVNEETPRESDEDAIGGDDGCGKYGSFALHSIGVWGLDLS